MSGEARPLAGVRNVLLALLALIAVAYVAVIVLYDPGGRLLIVTPAAESSPAAPADVEVRVEVVSADPGEYSSLLRLRVVSVTPELLNADGRIAAPLRLAVTSGDGTDDVVFPAGTALGRAEDSVAINGDESGYPFDTYEAPVSLDASVLVDHGGSSGIGATPLTLVVGVEGGVPGWDTTGDVMAADGEAVQLRLGFVRSFSTKFFAILLVLMALVIALYSLTVGISTITGRQPIDSSIVGWGASLLFALLALRYYLPGDPPIGAGIDMYAYIWIVLLAFIGLSMSVTMWLRR